MPPGVVLATTSTMPPSMNYDDSPEIPSESYELTSEIAYDVKSVTNRYPMINQTMWTTHRDAEAPELWF
jgi:hypothetical protein